MKMFPPKWRVKVYVVVILVATVLGGVLWHFREPSYNGRTLTEWLEQARFSGVNSEATSAVQQIGPRAVPMLVRMLQQKQPKWKVKLNEWFEKFDWAKKFAFEDRSDRAREDAEVFWAFYVLGPAARSAIPSLTAMLNDAEQGPRAVRALGALGVETAPLLLNALGSTNQEVRSEAVFALISFQTNVPGLSEQMWALRRDTNEYVAVAATRWAFRQGPSTQRVEVLVDALRDGRQATLSQALSCLRDLGTDWTNVLPEMAQLMNSPDQRTRVRITNAIRRLDPVIAASVGINTNLSLAKQTTNGPGSGGRRGPGGRGR